MGGGKLTNSDIVRQKAEELLNNRLKGNRQDADSAGMATFEYTEANALKLVHELEVRQIELELMLEMMTEELSLEKIGNAKRKMELFIANKEFAFQNEEKAKQAIELVIANDELTFQDQEKTQRAAELIVANKELLFQNNEKTQRAEELILANIELLFQNKEKEKRAAELAVANQLISSQRDRLDEIANLVPGVVFQYRLHPDGTSSFPYASEAIRQIYRVTPEEVRKDATNVFANLHPDDNDVVVASIQKSAKELTLLQQEYRVKFDDGTIRTHFANANPRLEVGGSVLWHGFITDITDKKGIAHQLEERLKELNVLYQLSQLTVEKEITLDALFQRLVDILPEGWQYPGIACARIVVDGVEFRTENFEDSAWQQSAPIMVNGFEIGLIEVDYLLEMPIADEGPFVKEERELIDTLALQLKQIIIRKNAEKALVESEEQLLLLMNSTAEGIYGIDLEGNCTNANKSCIESLGYKTEKDLLGRNMHYLIHHSYSDHRPMKVEECKIFLAFQQGNRTHIDDEVLWRADGTSFPVEYYSYPIFKNEQIVGAVVTFNDITERKKIEKALLDSQARYSSMISNISDVIGIMGTDGIMKYKSPNIEKFFGWLPEELVGMSVFSMIHPDDMEYAQKVFNSLLGEDNTVKTLEFRYKCKDYSYKPIELTAANLLNDPVINGILLNYRDISGRKAKEEEKLKADITIGILSLAINQSPVTVLITDLAGNIESVNSKFTEVTGYTAVEVIGQNPKILKAGDRPDADYKELWNTILSGGNWHGIFHNRKKNGELYWESAVISPVKDQYGTITHFLAVKEDITGRLKSEQEIKLKNEELQKLNFERDKFFAIIAHDLRGPLGSMKGLTEMMADESYEFTEYEIKEMTHDLGTSARNTFNLLENLLEWSQMDSGLTEFKPQKLGLMNMVTDCINVVSEQARGKGIALNVNIATGHEVLADKNMLQTVIRNLLSNAIKFTPKGGRVTISAKPAENNRMVISVKDTGIGMSDQIRNNLFNISANTKRPGTEGEKSTGLGLLLCKEFVEKNGGEIRIESEQNQGTIFSFTIPSTGQKGNEKAHLNAEFTEKSVGNINNLKILIAEDDDISAKLIHMMVKGFSREVFHAKTGKAAIEFCRNIADIDLVMMDIAMPFMDGYEATRQIRQFNQKVIIIAQTTFVFSADRENAFEAGCNDYITKPFGKEALIELIKKHIKK
jgi:PAS domain S-box-containing protein